jgi:hypothetical protein
VTWENSLGNQWPPKRSPHPDAIGMAASTGIARVPGEVAASEVGTLHLARTEHPIGNPVR